jgi:hypothetical protein
MLTSGYPETSQAHINESSLKNRQRLLASRVFVRSNRTAYLTYRAKYTILAKSSNDSEAQYYIEFCFTEFCFPFTPSTTKLQDSGNNATFVVTPFTCSGRRGCCATHLARFTCFRVAKGRQDGICAILGHGWLHIPRLGDGR